MPSETAVVTGPIGVWSARSGSEPAWIASIRLWSGTTPHSANLSKESLDPIIQMFSQREDVVLCNPFRPFARGPGEVAETIEQAASHYADGEYEPERVTAFATAELGYTVEIERFTATLDGNEGSGALRVTTIFRLEVEGWRIAHRHADPITTPRGVESVLQT